MVEFFKLIAENPWQAILTAVAAFGTFGGGVKLTGVIIDLLSRNRKKLNKRLSQIESSAGNVLTVIQGLGIDILKGKVEKTENRLDSALEKLSNLEKMQDTLLIMSAFVETIKETAWTEETKQVFESKLTQMLTAPLNATESENDPVSSVLSAEVITPELDPIDTAKKGKKRKVKIKKGETENVK